MKTIINLSISLLLLFILGCNTGVPLGTQVITPSNIYEPVTEETINVVIVDGQSNAMNPRLHAAINSELTILTGRETRLILCAIGASNFQSHLRGNSSYAYCANKRITTFSNINHRLVGIIILHGESNLNDYTYIWSDLFKQYKNEMRNDTEYYSLPIVFSQMPEILNIESVSLFQSNQQILADELYDDNVRMISTKQFPLHDGVHFEYPELPKIGKILAGSLYELMSEQGIIQ